MISRSVIDRSVLRWPAAAFWWRGRHDGGVGVCVFGDEIGMRPQAVARALDLDEDGVVQEPVRTPLEAFTSELGRALEMRFASGVVFRAGIHQVFDL